MSERAKRGGPVRGRSVDRRRREKKKVGSCAPLQPCRCCWTSNRGSATQYAKGCQTWVYHKIIANQHATCCCKRFSKWPLADIQMAKSLSKPKSRFDNGGQSMASQPKPRMASNAEQSNVRKVNLTGESNAIDGATGANWLSVATLQQKAVMLNSLKDDMQKAGALEQYEIKFCDTVMATPTATEQKFSHRQNARKHLLRSGFR